MVSDKKEGLEEFYRTGKGDALGWAIIFIWAAIVVLMEVAGCSKKFPGWDGWSVFFTGFGIIVLVGAVIYFSIGKTDKAIWNLVIGIILLIIGLGDLFNLKWIWVVIFLIIGIVILKKALKKK